MPALLRPDARYPLPRGLQQSRRYQFYIVKAVQRVQTRQREELIHQPGGAVDRCRMQLRQALDCASGSS